MLANDLALLELKEPFTFDKQTNIAPACLKRVQERNKDEFLVAAFGALPYLVNDMAADERNSSEYNENQLLMNTIKLSKLTQKLIYVKGPRSCEGNLGAPSEPLLTTN